MVLIKNECSDPYFNLAAEEYLLNGCLPNIFMLWRNNSAVVIGKNQNAIAEVDLKYASENGIAVVRRLTGGGAVFHDRGNINFTFITDADGNGEIDFGRFTSPIVSALQKMGINAVANGRNDITADGFKISGNAQCVYNTSDGRKRLLHHGTLLFCADVSRLAKVLVPNSEKLKSKGIGSVRSRVINIKDIDSFCGPHDPEAFMDSIFSFIAGDVPPQGFSDADIACIRELAESKYSTWDWNIGRSMPHSVRACRRFSFGTVEISLEAKGARIQNILIGGDFFGTKDIDLLCEALKGARLEPKSLAALLENVGEYISGATANDIADMILN